MKAKNLSYFNIYTILLKFLVLNILCFFVICCEGKQTKQVLSPNGGKLFAGNAININTASKTELEKLPNIGEKTAENIIEHREKYGDFRKPEHLLLVRGISDKKFRQIREFVKTE